MKTLTVSHYQDLSNLVQPDGSMPEWAMASIRRLLSPWDCDRLNFAFNDPVQFNPNGTVNPNAFGQVLNQLDRRGELSEPNLIKLIDAFTSKCSKSDWKYLYQPILKRATDHGLTMAKANRHLSDQYKVHMFDTQEQIVGFPQGDGYFYPWYGRITSKRFVTISNTIATLLHKPT